MPDPQRHAVVMIGWGMARDIPFPYACVSFESEELGPSMAPPTCKLRSTCVALRRRHLLLSLDIPPPVRQLYMEDGRIFCRTLPLIATASASLRIRRRVDVPNPSLSDAKSFGVSSSGIARTCFSVSQRLAPAGALDIQHGNRDFKQGATRISIPGPLGAPFKIHVMLLTQSPSCKSCMAREPELRTVK